jgi:hypothetical protein
MPSGHGGRAAGDVVRFERFPDCRHGVVPNVPEQAIALIQNFIVG